MERYVVHIFRRDPADPKKIAGIVECSTGHWRAGFLSSDAFLNILASRGGIPGERAGGPSRSGTGEALKSYSEIMESIRVEMECQES